MALQSVDQTTSICFVIGPRQAYSSFDTPSLLTVLQHESSSTSFRGREGERGIHHRRRALEIEIAENVLLHEE